MRFFALATILVTGGSSFLLGQDPIHQSLRLVDIVPNPAVAQGETFFGRSLDWDDTDILVGSYEGAHVYNAVTRGYKHRLGPVDPVDRGYGANVLITPGHFLVVAAYVNRKEKLHVYDRGTRSLERTLQPPSGSNQQPGFGTSMALQGDSLFVSILHNSPGNGEPSVGAVYLYDTNTWSRSSQVFRSGEGEWFDGFGQDIAVEDNILLVGANRKDGFKGAAYLFNTTDGALVSKIQMPTPAGNEWFGTTVTLNKGKAYVTSRTAVWEYDASTGAYLGKYSPTPKADFYDWFGSDVEVLDDKLLAVWSDAGLFLFDLETRQQSEVLNNPLDAGTFTSRPGVMKARGKILLTSASGGSDPGTSNGALLTFTTDPGELVVEVLDATASESQGEINVTFRVAPTPASDVTVNYETRQDSAREGMDYLGRSGTVTITGGQAEAVLTLELLNDTHSEPTERFFLDVLDGTGATVTPVEVELQITDDDPAPSTSGGLSSFPLATFVDDRLGYEVAAIGNTAYVTTLDIDGSALGRGGVHVVNLSTGEPITTVVPTGFPNDAQFGIGLAVRDDLLAIGASLSRDQPDTPAIYLYDRTTLTEEMVIRPPDENHLGFGSMIAIDDRFILVGLPYEDRRGYQVGDVHVYDAVTGLHRYRIENPTNTLGSQFGVALTFSGNRAVIGSAGRVYVFELGETNANLQFEVERSTRDTAHITSDFGEEVVANEDFIVVGNPWDDSFHANSGSALVYDARSGAHLNTIRSRFVTGTANFGAALSLSGNILAVAGTRDLGVHLIEIPSGHELVRFRTNGAVQSGYLQQVELTDGFVVVGAPWGHAIDTGSLVTFRRDGNEYGLWKRGTVIGSETFNLWSQQLSSDELFFRYATGWRDGDHALSISPWERKHILAQVTTRGDLRPDARYWIQTSAEGGSWRNLVEVSPTAELEGQPMSNRWDGDLMQYSFRDSRLGNALKGSLYRLLISSR